MATIFRVYKDNVVVTEGASPLYITGLEPNTLVPAGTYKVTKVIDDVESEKVDIKTFTTLSDAEPTMLPIGQAVIGKSNKVR